MRTTVLSACLFLGAVFCVPKLVPPVDKKEPVPGPSAILFVPAPPVCMYIEGEKGAGLRTTCTIPEEDAFMASFILKLRSEVDGSAGDRLPCAFLTHEVCASRAEAFDAIGALNERRSRERR